MTMYWTHRTEIEREIRKEWKRNAAEFMIMPKVFSSTESWLKFKYTNAKSNIGRTTSVRHCLLFTSKLCLEKGFFVKIDRFEQNKGGNGLKWQVLAWSMTLLNNFDQEYKYCKFKTCASSKAIQFIGTHPSERYWR